MKKKLQINNGITLVALVVTVVVLLILTGITIVYVFEDNGVFKQAQEAKLRMDIAKYQEMLETAKGTVFIEGLGTFDPDRYFEVIENQKIIEDKDTDVVDNNDGTYDITTKPGYIFLITLIPTKENPTDANIEYIGQAGKIVPIIKSLEVSATQTSITGKATVVRLGNGTATYYYKPASADDSEYKEITNVNAETGATQSTGITAGTEYIIKVVAKNEIGETQKTEAITATKTPVESITLNKIEETIKEGATVTLVATVKPDDATNKNVTWESSDTAIATVSDTGVVTGEKAGTATITAKATDGSDKSASCTITVISPTVAEIVDQKQDDTTTVEDGNGNPITIPGGFRVLPHGTKSADIDEVIYNYDTNHKPCVQDGIVIADDENNQFVWIPVGEIKNKEGDVNGTTTMITLGRYTFDTTDGTPTLQQDAVNWTQKVTINSYFQELSSSSVPLPAWNLGDFIAEANGHGGYYLGRYEASYKDATHCYCKKTTIDPRGSASTNLKSGMVWNYVTQHDAAVVARNAFRRGDVKSDLVNSYAWDTAIVFIQAYSGDNNYSQQGSKNTSIANTGSNNDKVCNIHDMASNCSEWSTEYSSNRSGKNIWPCVGVGGFTTVPSVTSSYRGYYGETERENYLSFRPICYVD